MTYYLTAFINDTRHSYRDILRLQHTFYNLDSAVAELTSAILQKKNENWDIEQGDGKNMEKGCETNAILYAIAEHPTNKSTVMYTITTEKTPTLDNEAMFPEAEDITDNESGNTKTVSDHIKSLMITSINCISYLNKRPRLSFLILMTVIGDIIWLNTANFFRSGLFAYFKYRPLEAWSIVAIGIAVIFFLIKKVNK